MNIAVLCSGSGTNLQAIIDNTKSGSIPAKIALVLSDKKDAYALERALAVVSKTPVELRDPIANYHKFTVSDAVQKYPHLALHAFLDASGIPSLPDVIIHQPGFFAALDALVQERPLEDWKTYLRWHVLKAMAPALAPQFDGPHFAFFMQTLRGVEQQPPRWKRCSRAFGLR